MSESHVLDALACEASRKHMSYGMFVATLSQQERQEILQTYSARKRRKKRGTDVNLGGNQR